MVRVCVFAALALFSVALATPAEHNRRTTPRPQSTTTKRTSSSQAKTTTPPGTSSSTTTASTTEVNPDKPGTTLLATETSRSYGLNNAAKRAGKKFFGAAMDSGTAEDSDPYYMAAFNNSHDFGEATPANAMKFVNTQPEPGVYDFAPAEHFLALAEGSNKVIRCHCLPEWVTSPATPWTNETLSAVLKQHIQTLVEYFGDRCYSWDVVNEAFSDSPAGAYAPSVWYDTIGPSYVEQAFAAAQETSEKNKLEVKLYYNDYNIESPGAKSTAAQNLAKSLKGQGIQIDGVGLESHFIAGSTPSQADQEANMQAFADLGVEVVVTELDVRTTLPPTLEAQQQQVQDFHNTIAACVSVKECVGMVVWDFVDTYSWIPSTFEGQGYGTPFLQPRGANTPLVAKAAYDGILDALEGR